jgi:hypothetical protein
MFEMLSDSPLLLSAAIALAAVLNYVVSLASVKAHARQTFVERLDWRPSGLLGKARSAAAQYALPFIGAAVLIALTAVMDRRSREWLGGGFLVMQIASLGSNIADLLALRALRLPGAAEGRLRYSPAYGFRAAAARLVGMALVVASIGMLLWSGPLVAGAILLLATAAGWYRRAYQASRAQRSTSGN